jgi:hypothetical protein
LSTSAWKALALPPLPAASSTGEPLVLQLVGGAFGQHGQQHLAGIGRLALGQLHLAIGGEGQEDGRQGRGLGRGELGVLHQAVEGGLHRGGIVRQGLGGELGRQLLVLLGEVGIGLFGLGGLVQGRLLVGGQLHGCSL